MTKTKKLLIAVLTACVLVCLSLFTLTACGGKKVESIKITTKPNKITYEVGEKFDPTGMVVTAIYSDGNTKELPSKNWKYAVDEAYLDDSGNLKIDGTKEEARGVKVTVTYKELTAAQSINITKPVASLTKLTDPAKLTYFKGESFDPAGMTVIINYTDGTSKNNVVVSAENGFEFDPEGAIPGGTTKVTVKYGKVKIDVNITLENAVYIQAIDGLYNRRPVEEVDAEAANDQKHIRTDATLESAQSGAEALYRGHLNNENYDEGYGALLQARFLKDWTYDGNDEPDEVTLQAAKRAALNAYKSTDGYKNAEKDIEGAVADFKAGTNADIDDWNYEKLCARFVTTNPEGKYLGEIHIGDTVSFVFDSSEQTTGDITFRLASGFVTELKDWVSSKMNDMDFSKLCDMFVNGKQVTIEEGEVILEGGETEDGSACVQLWMFWAEVTFDDIDFVEGRNVIELKFKDIGENNAYGNAPGCNIDSLIIRPNADSAADIDLYDNTNAGGDLLANLTVTALAMAKAENSDEVTLTVSGTIKGYYEDIFALTVGESKADTTWDGESFTSVIKLSKAGYGNFNLLIVGTEFVKPEGLEVTEKTITLENEAVDSYKLSVESNKVKLEIDASKLFIFDKDSVTRAEQPTLVREGSRVYYVIGGGTFDATIKGYEGEELAIVAEQIADRIKSLLNFEMQNNPNVSSTDKTWDAYIKDKFTVIVDAENKTYSIKADLSSLDSSAYTTHFQFYSLKTDTNGWNDFKPNQYTEFTTIATKTARGRLYQLVIYPNSSKGEEYWGNVGLIVGDDTALPKATLADNGLVAEDGEVYYTVTINAANFTAATLVSDVEQTVEIDFESTTSGKKKVAFEDLIIGELGADGKLTIKIDITDFTVGIYVPHFNGGNVYDNKALAKVTAAGKDFEVKSTTVSAWNWTAHLLNVSEAEEIPEPPATDTLNGTTWTGTDMTGVAYTLTFADGNVTVQKEGEEAVTGTYEGTAVTVEGYTVTVNDDDTITLVIDDMEIEITFTKVTESDGE